MTPGSRAVAASGGAGAGAAVEAPAPGAGPTFAGARIGSGRAPMGVRDRGRGRWGVPNGMHIGMCGNLVEPLGGGRRGHGGGSWRGSSCQIPRGGTAAEVRAVAGARKRGKAENTGGFGWSGLKGWRQGIGTPVGVMMAAVARWSGIMGNIPGGRMGRGGGSTLAGGFRTGDRERERVDPWECV
jgi:hypothetical protein